MSMWVGPMTALDFYNQLASRYLREAERFVPNYHEMIREIVEVVKLKKPGSILDLGCGVGNLEKMLLEQVHVCDITCLDVSLKMVKATAMNLKRYAGRTKVVCSSIEKFNTHDRFDCVISNLALHNLSGFWKKKVLQRIRDSLLEPSGLFIWGDLIRHADLGVQKQFVEYRKRYALERGASLSFVERNFIKELNDDWPLTLCETDNRLRTVGFSHPELLWKNTTFALFSAR